jgi:succinate dehydrogenase/fumarate reductase flavoprotein subunit
MAAPRVAVVGGGLAGLMTTLKLAEAGVPVDLFSIVPVKRSHSVCAQGGINGAVNVKGEDDSPEIHFVDTCRGGDFLAHQPPVKGMCYAAPRHHLPVRPHGRDLQSHAGGTARVPPLRRDDAPSARRSPGPRPGSSCSTRSTSRCAGTRPRAW